MVENFKMKNKIILLLILGALLFVGCGKITTQEREKVKEFDIIAKNWEFIPDTIEVNLGDKVELHIKSVDVVHGFALPDFGINEKLEPHQDVHVEFVADKKGIFTFACSVPCGSGHRGMKGQLIVK